MMVLEFTRNEYKYFKNYNDNYYIRTYSYITQKVLIKKVMCLNLAI